MSICHTAIVTRHKAGLSSNFISDSEDEIALLSFANQTGYRFCKKENNVITLKIYGKRLAFKVIGTAPFDPVRKMMSVIVETEQGQVVVFTKGADSSILKVCNLPDNKREKI